MSKSFFWKLRNVLKISIVLRQNSIRQLCGRERPLQVLSITPRPSRKSRPAVEDQWRAVGHGLDAGRAAHLAPGGCLSFIFEDRLKLRGQLVVVDQPVEHWVANQPAGFDRRRATSRNTPDHHVGNVVDALVDPRPVVPGRELRDCAA
jgi:hypothetical protein